MKRFKTSGRSLNRNEMKITKGGVSSFAAACLIAECKDLYLAIVCFRSGCTCNSNAICVPA
jgi:hypothetical protein